MTFRYFGRYLSLNVPNCTVLIKNYHIGGVHVHSDRIIETCADLSGRVKSRIDHVDAVMVCGRNVYIYKE